MLLRLHFSTQILTFNNLLIKYRFSQFMCFYFLIGKYTCAVMLLLNLSEKYVTQIFNSNNSNFYFKNIWRVACKLKIMHYQWDEKQLGLRRKQLSACFSSGSVIVKDFEIV
eukprot:TRINITY_DN6568_c0_g2_i3.p3 TRINITY_DN6568_c0_g2~~TRINITY_DN6568_c0_g2_i3.p3  ORF type:complete len:111 (-),score=1.37 TRINITY_DN6568_c0_g2_i3:23-355(-)